MEGGTAQPRPALRDPDLWRDALVLALLAAGLLAIAWSAALLPLGRGWGFDFSAYYQAALRLAATGTPYEPATMVAPFDLGPAGLYVYSPLPALAVQPLTALDQPSATAAWFGLRVGLLVVTCLLMPVSLRLRLAMIGLAGLSLPVLLDLSLGNVSLIVTALTVVAWRFLDRPLAALAVAGSLFLRPTMALIIGWWLVRRRLAAVAWAALGAGALVVLSLPLIGLQPYLDYVVVLRNLGTVTGVANNLDLGSTALALGAPPSVATLALLAGYAVAIGASLLSLRRDRELSFVVVSMAMLFISPVLWEHYLTQLLIPAAFLGARGRRWGLALPLLAWAPALGVAALLPLLGLAAMVLPFVAPARGVPALERPPDGRLVG